MTRDTPCTCNALRFPRYSSLCMIVIAHSRVVYYALPFPRYTEKPCDNGQESSRVDEELRLLHKHRRAVVSMSSVMHIVGSVRLGLRPTKRHCSSQFREYVATNYRPRGKVLGRVSVYSIICILLSSVTPVQCTQTANGFVLVPKSSHSTFAYFEKACGYSSVGAKSGRHSPYDFTYSSICRVVSGLVSIQGR